MQKEWITQRLLIEKSRETGVPFSGLLGGAVLEETVRRISMTKEGENLWLKNSTILGKEQYKKNLSLSLEYDFFPLEGEEICLPELAESLRQQAFGENDDYGIVFSQTDRLMKKYLLILFEAKFLGMQTPVSVKIFPCREERQIPKKECFSLILFPQVTVAYNRCQTEDILVENYMEIITKLELILDMRVYYDSYRLLGSESVDGRRVREGIGERCRKQGITVEDRRLQMIAGYQNYAYMKKKWKAFLRSVNEKEPPWELVIERLMKFFSPIWDSIAKDLIFFEDWMPELGRFL